MDKLWIIGGRRVEKSVEKPVDLRCKSWECCAVKMIAEYLEHALSFERMAAHEKDSKLKAEFEKQAEAYRRLATKRAHEIGANVPPDPKNSN